MQHLTVMLGKDVALKIILQVFILISVTAVPAYSEPKDAIDFNNDKDGSLTCIAEDGSKIALFSAKKAAVISKGLEKDLRKKLSALIKLQDRIRRARKLQDTDRASRLELLREKLARLVDAIIGGCTEALLADSRRGSGEGKPTPKATSTSGAAVTPKRTPTKVAEATKTPTPRPGNAFTFTPTSTPVPPSTFTPTRTPTFTPTQIATFTATITATPTRTPTPTAPGDSGTTPNSCGSPAVVCPGIDDVGTKRTCVSGQCGIVCKGEYYDVDGTVSNGCEVQDDLPIHARTETAKYIGDLYTCANAPISATGRVPGDFREHEAEPIYRNTGRWDVFYINVIENGCSVVPTVSLDLGNFASDKSATIRPYWACDNNSGFTSDPFLVTGGTVYNLSLNSFSCGTGQARNGKLYLIVETFNGIFSGSTYTVSARFG